MDAASDVGMDLAINLVPASSPVPLGSTVKATASIWGQSAVAEAYLWYITDPNGDAVKVKVESSNLDRVSFVVAREGTYSVVCKVRVAGYGDGLQKTVPVQVADPGKPTLEYTVRILPPPDSGLPPVDRKVLVGAVDQRQLSWVLDRGKAIAVSLTHGGQAVAGYLRLFRDGSDPLPRDLYVPTAGVEVQLSGTSHALVFPHSGAVAPNLVLGKDAQQMTKASWPIALTRGIQVQGTVRSSSAALVGARVSLRTKSLAGEIPSTVGTVGSSGAFSLLARPGAVGLTVTPPLDSGLPLARVSSGSVSLAGDATGWAFRYDPLTIATLSGTVTLADNSTVVSGATVLVRSVAGSRVGALSLAGAKPVAATGLVTRTLTTDAGGRLLDEQRRSSGIKLPQGQYTAEIWPGPSTPLAQGFARHSLIVAGGGMAPIRMALAKRATISGSVVGPDGNPVAAKVEASAASGDFTGRCDAAGKFNLLVDANVTYRLTVRADRGVEGASSYVATGQHVTQSLALPAIKLPKATEISGRLVVSGGVAVAGALVRVWCSDVTCAGNTVIEEMRTPPDGSFLLRVPPP